MKHLLIIVTLGLLAALLTGCERPLFTDNTPRTQYERFDRLRGTYAPTESVDAYGRPAPALRERLTTYDQ